MKFAGQVASYQNKLRRRSRFFSSLMLVSGLSLAAAAPFLSYEVSKVECIEKGSVAAAPDCSSEVSTLENELAGKVQAITGLEKEVEDKKRELRNLARNPDCDNLVRVIEDERDRLDTELAEVTTESLGKDESINQLREQLADCEQQNTQIGSTKPNCDEYTKVITTLRRTIITKEQIITQLNEAPKPDCDNYIGQVAGLERDIVAKDQIIARLRATPPKVEKCPAVRISGSINYNEILVLNSDLFVITRNSDDVGWFFKLLHNGKDVTSKITYDTRKRRVFKFIGTDKRRYQIILAEQLKTGLKFSLNSY